MVHFEIAQPLKCKREICANCKLYCEAIVQQQTVKKWNFDEVIISGAHINNALITSLPQLHISCFQKRKKGWLQTTKMCFS